MATMNRVRIVYTGVAGTPWYSNFYTLSPPTSAATAHAAVVTLCNAIKGLISSSVSMNVEGDVAQVDEATGNIVGVVSVTPVTVVGTGSGTALPYSNQVLVQLLTGAYAGGRQVRGRFNIPGLLTTSLGSAGTVVITTQNTVNSAIGAYLTGLAASAGVYSRTNGTLVPITSGKAWTQFSVLRSRRD